MPRRALLILAVICLGGCGAIRAAERAHVVRSGESISAIARDYYGDTSLAELLRICNALPDNTIRAGETLRIPYAEPHLVRSGDTWSGLARRHTGRASAYPALALLNGLSPDEPLARGARILLPAVVAHTLEPGESLALLADRFYGDATRGDLLALFNDIEDPHRLSIGQTVDVPLVSLVLEEPERRAAGSGTAKAGAKAATPAPGSSRADAGRPAEPLPAETVAPAATAAPPESSRVDAGQAAGSSRGEAGALEAAAATPEPSPVDDTPAAGSSPGESGAREATALTPRPPQVGARPAAGPSPAKAGESAAANPVIAEPIDEPAGPPPPVPPKTGPSRYARRIDAALAAYRYGDYERARQVLESLRGSVESDGNDDEALRLLHGLAFVYIAYDLPGPACEAYGAAPRIPGGSSFDPDEISPKIRGVLAGCAKQQTSSSSAKR